MSCAMKVQLSSEYEAATAEFSKVAAELRRNIGTSTKENYEQLGHRANEARMKSEQARRTLEQHMAEHHC